MQETTTKELQEVIIKQELLINAQREDLLTLHAQNKSLKAEINKLYDIYDIQEFHCY